MSILGLPVCIIDLSPSRKMLPFLQDIGDIWNMTTTQRATSDSLEYDSDSKKGFPLFKNICAPNEYELNQYDTNLNSHYNPIVPIDFTLDRKY